MLAAPYPASSEGDTWTEDTGWGASWWAAPSGGDEVACSEASPESSCGKALERAAMTRRGEGCGKRAVIRRCLISDIGRCQPTPPFPFLFSIDPLRFRFVSIHKSIPDSP